MIEHLLFIRTDGRNVQQSKHVPSLKVNGGGTQRLHYRSHLGCLVAPVTGACTCTGTHTNKQYSRRAAWYQAVSEATACPAWQAEGKTFVAFVVEILWPAWQAEGKTC
jgi:hypothetical protein